MPDLRLGTAEGGLTERKRVEQAVLATEQESRLIVDTIPGLVALLSATGDVEFVNRQLLEYFGQTLEELRQWGMGGNGTVHPEDLPHVIDVFSRSIVAGTPYSIEQRFRRADGVYHWFENTGFPVRDAAGRVARWCVLLTDIDERKRAEQAQRESEREARLIVDSIPGLVAVFSRAGEVEVVNRQALEYFGKTLDDLRHWGTDDSTTHPEDRPRVLAAFARSIASGTPFEVQVRARRFDGVYRWFESRAFPLRDTQGQIVRWYNLLIDIDERKRAEEALARSERNLQLTIDTIPGLAWSTGPDGSADFFNQHYLDFVGLSAEQASGWGWTSVVHPDDLSELATIWTRMLAAEVPGEAEARLRRYDGEYHWFLFRAQPLRDETGRIVKWFGINTDIQDRKQAETEYKAAEEALDRARSELARVARATTLSTLTASIAHEVNQPLSGIITNASTCLRMLDADPPNVDGARETVRRTIRDGNRASDVIARLRALFSKKDFALESLDLNEAVREVIALVSSDLQRNRIALRAELADDLPPVTGDRVQLQQVVLNLLRNAFDAVADVDDAVRRVAIRTAPEGEDRVRVTVQDSGAGIGDTEAEKLFGAFYTTKEGGMGIGLSISRSIVESHHGHIWASANDGPGATFAFSIPCHQGHGVRQGEVNRPIPSSNGWGAAPP